MLRRSAPAAGLLLALAVAVGGCSASPTARSDERALTTPDAGPTASGLEAPSSEAPPSAPPPAGPVAGLGALGSPPALPGPVPGSRAPVPGGQLPPPATPTQPARPPAAGTLGTVEWASHRHAGACPGARPGTVVLGDLDGDRVDEAAAPLTCPASPRDTGSVPVYAGDAKAPRLLGDALPAEERASVYRVEVRDGLLVVTGLTSSDRAAREPDTAVTIRWELSDGRLVLVDRYTDPASVLVADAEEEGHTD